MTTTYDPTHPTYLDEADVRDELTRAFDVCHGCRRCVELCAVFPTLFEMIERRGGDAGELTPAEQDEVVGACFHCRRCTLDCPYLPGHHELAVDVPRLVLRAGAMHHATGRTSVRWKVATRLLGHGGGLGAAATTLLGAEPGSATRKVAATLTGVSAVRLLPPSTKQRFSTWFAERAAPAATDAAVTVFATCAVEYHEPRIGKDLVRVYERNGVACATSAAGCCGAPWLQAGDIGRFTEIAGRNVATLAAEVRRGTDVVVPQPTCGDVLKHDYLDHVAGPDARLVAEHTYDAAEYLVRRHAGGGPQLDTGFTGERPTSVTYHAPCRLRSQRIDLPGRDLLELTGAEVTVVERCAGGDTWGLRAGHEHLSLPVARQLGAEIDRAGGEAVAGDCHLANTAIAEQTGRTPHHPLSVLARAYGIDAD